jgi:hypothetical protein
MSRFKDFSLTRRALGLKRVAGGGFIATQRQIIRKVTALRVAFGCAVKCFAKVFSIANKIHTMKGDTVTVEYSLEIK